MPKAQVQKELQATITKTEAAKLDATIDNKIRETADHLAKTYLEVGGYLRRMRETQGFIHLGFERWENYLDSKREFGRTYLSYLYKLGQAGELQQYLAQGMSGTKLIEFAKRTDFPEKIPQLIDATWEDVKDKSVRETALHLGNFVRKHEAEYRRPKAKKGGRPRQTVKARLKQEYDKLTDAEKKAFVSQLKALLKEL